MSVVRNVTTGRRKSIAKAVLADYTSALHRGCPLVSALCCYPVLERALTPAMGVSARVQEVMLTNVN